uniref:Uncharacterized protein n=1 Tax=Arundo donax TaxID=35708 RepID=A0A0A9CZN7_ARUDO
MGAPRRRRSSLAAGPRACAGAPGRSRPTRVPEAPAGAPGGGRPSGRTSATPPRRRTSSRASPSPCFE